MTRTAIEECVRAGARTVTVRVALNDALDTLCVETAATHANISGVAQIVGVMHLNVDCRHTVLSHGESHRPESHSMGRRRRGSRAIKVIARSP